MLMRALVNYKNFDLEPTVKMWNFVSWLKEREDEIFSNWYTLQAYKERSC